MAEKTYIIGPCAAETEKQVMTIAEQLHHGETQGVVFRAGIWKPRTSPDTFQGVGDKGLSWLQRIQRELGLPVATEVSTPEQVSKALQAGIEYIWIGARTCANPIAVQTIADTIRHSIESGAALKGIGIKNPVNEDPALWIGNIQRLQAAISALPTCTIAAIHRGCNHHPCWQMAYTLRKQMPAIPLLLDPSHMSGDAACIAPLCQVAEDLEYDGLMVEVHHQPEQALSDAKQQITPQSFQDIATHLLHTPHDSATPLELRWLRRMIDEIDNALWELVARRMAISQRIGNCKRTHDMPILQPTRFEEIMERRLAWAREQGLSEDTVRQIMNLLHSESIRMQK